LTSTNQRQIMTKAFTLQTYITVMLLLELEGVLSETDSGFSQAAINIKHSTSILIYTNKFQNMYY